MDIFSLVGKITINYADAVNNIEKVSKSAKDTAETLENVDKKADTNHCHCPYGVCGLVTEKSEKRQGRKQ